MAGIFLVIMAWYGYKMHQDMIPLAFIGVSGAVGGITLFLILFLDDLFCAFFGFFYAWERRSASNCNPQTGRRRAIK